MSNNTKLNIYRNFLYIYYLNTEQDTCSNEYTLQIIDNISNVFKSYLPELTKDWKLEIYNKDLNINYSPFECDSKKKIVRLTTKALEEHGWDYLISKVMATIFMHKIKFKKHNHIKKKWFDLRQHFNTNKPEETFIEDFINLFGTELLSDKRYSNVDPDKINGLRSLYLIWFSVLNSTSFYDLILYREFVSVPRVNYLGYIYIVYNIRTKQRNWNKITSQGFWTYSNLSDQWSLNSRFK